MEVLRVLEEKIGQLIEAKRADRELIDRLKKENDSLQQENQRLVADIDRLENDALAFVSESSNELTRERETTKVAVDELIHNIDALLEKEIQA
ncbi:MAG: hypothetical protein M1549_02575 [Candidatus Dependentiae bacterium]|nr:hypothetical protein [Candidatus Dependentiae bacterium]